MAVDWQFFGKSLISLNLCLPLYNEMIELGVSSSLKLDDYTLQME